MSTAGSGNPADFGIYIYSVIRFGYVSKPYKPIILGLNHVDYSKLMPKWLYIHLNVAIMNSWLTASVNLATCWQHARAIYIPLFLYGIRVPSAVIKTALIWELTASLIHDRVGWNWIRTAKSRAMPTPSCQAQHRCDSSKKFGTIWKIVMYWSIFIY